MRVVIWNAHWATLGGGEVYAGRLAEVCQQEGFNVVLVGIQDSPVSDLESRLGIDLKDFEYVKIRFERDLQQITRKGDLFINASFGSTLSAPNLNSIYICHFPTQSLRQRFSWLINRAQGLQVLDENYIPIHFFGGVSLLVGSGSLTAKPDESIDLECMTGSFDVCMPNGEICRLEMGATTSVIATKDTLNLNSIGSSASVLKILTKKKKRLIDYLFLHANFKARHFPQTYGEIWANSLFTSSYVKSRWNVKSEVVYPPTTLMDQPTGHRDPYQILSIGRFMSPLRGHSKNQIELIEAFEELAAGSNLPWKLNLVGGLDDSNLEYFNRVKNAVEKSPHPINLFPNCDSDTKQRLVSESNYFWHAGGLGIPESKPEKMEHFGIAVVEAIDSGLIPIVFNAAGPAEILGAFPQLLFKTLPELSAKTIALSQLESQEILEIRSSLRMRSEIFSTENFSNVVKNQLQKFKSPHG
jgi:glycosyltransferase involved in cell wall biosynthesis